MQKNPADTFPFYFFTTHFNIILPSMPVSSKQYLLAFRFSTKTVHPFLFSPMHTTFLTHLICLYSNTPKLYLARSTNYEAHRALFSSFVELSSSCPNTLLKHTRSMFFPQCEKLSFISVQNNRQNYTFVYFI